ncbi:hypothetical protein B0H10DRAFT_2432020 [Mycena sp. CBHHK59/15]|nr:hypothetical protein B0H10DRAFT_2432020 [Mycena sp. CBHHK59/15]
MTKGPENCDILSLSFLLEISQSFLYLNFGAPSDFDLKVKLPSHRIYAASDDVQRNDHINVVSGASSLPKILTAVFQVVRLRSTPTRTPRPRRARSPPLADLGDGRLISPSSCTGRQWPQLQAREAWFREPQLVGVSRLRGSLARRGCTLSTGAEHNQPCHSTAHSASLHYPDMTREVELLGASVARVVVRSVIWRKPLATPPPPLPISRAPHRSIRIARSASSPGSRVSRVTVSPLPPIQRSSALSLSQYDAHSGYGPAAYRRKEFHRGIRVDVPDRRRRRLGDVQRRRSEGKGISASASQRLYAREGGEDKEVDDDVARSHCTGTSPDVSAH